eukprot:g12091.t1
MEGAKLLSGSPIGHVLQDLERRLRVATESRPNFTGRILTPTELQEAVLRAIRPEGRQSRLFAALLAVAMGWWHEVNGDEQLFANALGRAAIGARRELSALDAAVRPTPLLPVRELWDQGAEEQLKAFGAVSLCFNGMTGLWILPATSSDLSAAASVAVRALRWTRGWLDTPTFTDDDYALLSSREAPVYQSIYLNDTGYPSTMLVARLRETDPPKKESNWWSEWFDLGGSGSSSKVVGCVGCEVKCFNRLSNQQLPNTQYDGCQQTVLRPVMADLAVAEECRGRGVARKLVEQLEESRKHELVECGESEVVRTWGYDELVLLVEASNFQARGVYGRLGYRLAGLRPAEATFFLDKSGGGRQVAERKTVALILRKSLKPFPQGALENFDWLTLFIALGLGSLILGQTELGDVGDLWPKLLALMNSAAKLADRREVLVTGCDSDDPSGNRPLSTAWSLLSGLTAEVLRSFRLMDLEVLTELRLCRPESSMEVDNGGLLPDNRREVSLRFFVPVDGQSWQEATLALQTKEPQRCPPWQDRELALSYPIEAGRAYVWWSRQSFHQLLGGHLRVGCRPAEARPQEGVCLRGRLTPNAGRLHSRETKWEVENCALTCCLSWRLGANSAFSIKLEQLQNLHEQIGNHITVFRAMVLFDDATSGLVMGNGVEEAGMTGPDSMTRLGQLLCRWALSQSPSIGMFVGVDYGVLHSVQGLLSMPNGTDQSAYFGPVCAGARELADTSRQEGMVHVSAEAKEQLSALRFLPLALGSQNTFYLDAFTEVIDPHQQMSPTRPFLSMLDLEGDQDKGRRMSFEEFKELLQNHRVNLSKFGKGTAKSLHHFYTAVVREEKCFLELKGSRLQRFVELVRIHLRFRNKEGKLRELKIDSEMTEEGRQRERKQLLAMVMRLQDQGNWRAALSRCFETNRPRPDDAASNGSWGSGGDSDEDPSGSFDFPALEEQVRSAIQRLNGQVLPKLNWSAPKDARWIHGTLKCCNPSEVFTVLKARWHSLYESSEFRTFIRDGRLMAISQRQTSGFFEHLLKEDEVEEIKTAIRNFFEEKVRGRFPLRRYVMDLYVDIPPRRKVWLVDFSPWGPTTEPLLFDWSELRAELRASREEEEDPVLRVVRDQSECHGKLESFHQVPLELAELNSQEGLNELLEKAVFSGWLGFGVDFTTQDGKMKWVWSPVLNSKEDDLMQLLQKHGIDISEFTWQSFAELYTEVYEESLSTVDVEEDQLVRRVSIVKVWLEANVFNEKHVLVIKTKQQRGRTQNFRKLRTLSMRMRSLQTWNEAVAEALFLRLGISAQQQQETLHIYLLETREEAARFARFGHGRQTDGLGEGSSSR